MENTVAAVKTSKQVAGLFPGEPVPCPVAGLADALEGYDSLSEGKLELVVCVKQNADYRAFGERA